MQRHECGSSPKALAQPPLLEPEGLTSDKWASTIWICGQGVYTGEVATEVGYPQCLVPLSPLDRRAADTYRMVTPGARMLTCFHTSRKTATAMRVPCASLLPTTQARAEALWMCTSLPACTAPVPSLCRSAQAGLTLVGGQGTWYRGHTLARRHPPVPRGWGCLASLQYP